MKVRTNKYWGIICKENHKLRHVRYQKSCIESINLGHVHPRLYYRRQIILSLDMIIQECENKQKIGHVHPSMLWKGKKISLKV